VISGLNGSNCILTGIAKIRVKNKMIERAEIVGTKGDYVVEFYGKCAEWNGKPVVLCSQRDPCKPKRFRSLDGAVSQISEIGLDRLSIIIR